MDTKDITTIKIKKSTKQELKIYCATKNQTYEEAIKEKILNKDKRRLS